jgi:hypothetical protein
MKIRITLLLIQCNTKLPRNDPNSVKLLLDEDDNIPYIDTHKDVEESLRELCTKYLKVDYDWLLKELVDFRVVKDSKYPYTFVGEAVYTTNVPPIDGALISGKLLSLEEIYSRNIGVDEFYERILIGSGRNLFR